MKGICLAGNMSVDHIYPVKSLPKHGTLAHILEGIEHVTGGAVNNVIMDLAKMDEHLPLQAVGRLGRDADGEFVLKAMGCFPNIDVSQIIRCDVATSFTLVLSDLSNSERTMLTYPGASGTFCETDVNWDNVDADLIHVAYIMLLGALDAEDPEYGTHMARLLHEAQRRGKRTSVDVVSESADRFKKLVPPALKYTNYLTINEIEAEQTTGIVLRDEDGALVRENMRPALEALKAMGVATWTTIHAPEGGFGLDENGQYHERASLPLPEGFIEGTVGAGDAFCAGILYSIEREWPMEEALRFANAAAACSLRKAGSTDGLCCVEEIWAMEKRLLGQD